MVDSRVFLRINADKWTTRYGGVSSSSLYYKRDPYVIRGLRRYPSLGELNVLFPENFGHLLGALRTIRMHAQDFTYHSRDYLKLRKKRI